MKVKVLNQMAVVTLGFDGEGTITVPDALAKSMIEQGYVEQVTEKKVERATKAPGEKSVASKPKA
jgi:hypothetical protein